MSKDIDIKNFKYYPYIPFSRIEAKQKEYYAKNIIKSVYSTPSSSLSTEKATVKTSKIICDTPVSTYNVISFNQQDNQQQDNQQQDNQQQNNQQQEDLTVKRNELQDQIDIQKTILKPNIETIKEQQEIICDNEKQIKKQEFAITYNTTISEQVIQNINSLNIELTNKTNMLNSINNQTADAQSYLQDLQAKINSSQSLLENLHANIYNCQQELSYHRSMINQIHMMIQNPQYVNQMITPYEII